MNQVIRKSSMHFWITLKVAATLFLFSPFVILASRADAHNFDGAFSSVAMSEKDLAPALDGSVVQNPRSEKLANKKPHTRRTTLADLLGSDEVLAEKIERRIADGDLSQKKPVNLQPADDGILIAVEKKNQSGQVERQEAIVSVEDLDDLDADDVALKNPRHDDLAQVKRGGIALTLGDEREVVHVLSTTVGISVQPPTVKMRRVGASVEISIDELAGAGGSRDIQIYPRDSALLHWDAHTKILTAVANHVRTEIYVARSGQLAVVPVVIGSPVAAAAKLIASGPALALPPELVRLPVGDLTSAVTGPNSGHAMHAANDFTGGLTGGLQDSSVAGATGIHLSKEAAAQQVTEAAAVQDVKLRRTALPLTRRTLRLKLIDDRTPALALDGAKAFPVAGVQVYVAGAEFSSLSDSHGGVSLSDLPGASSLLLATNDASGIYVRTTAVVDIPGASRSSDKNSGAIVRDVVVARVFAFEAWTRMAGLVQDPGLGSLCLDFAGKSVGAIRAQIDVKAQGPFHFNADGVLDHSAAATLDGGRVCWFNIDAGPVNISAWQAERQVMAAEFPVLAGRHTHERVSILADVQGVHVQFARESSAHEQLSGEALAQRYMLETEQEAVLVATTQKFFETAPNIQGVGSQIFSPGSSTVVYLDSQDFEPAIYRLRGAPSSREVAVLPAIPRGFVQDMSVYAQQSQDFTDGSVLVEFSAVQGQGSGKLDIHLVNEYGQNVTEPWVFSDAPMSKALFFNVPPGIYSAIIESQSGGWLAAETVSVYGESLSVVQLGSPLAAYFTPDAHH